MFYKKISMKKIKRAQIQKYYRDVFYTKYRNKIGIIHDLYLWYLLIVLLFISFVSWIYILKRSKIQWYGYKKYLIIYNKPPNDIHSIIY